MFSIIIFKLKRAFFKNDTSVILYSLSFFSLGILLYFIIKIISTCFTIINTPLWPLEIFFPFWISFVGLFVAIMVSLKINLSETQTGEDFLINLISEIGYLNKKDILIIITPNLNIGQYKYPDLFKQFSKSLIAAQTRGVRIEFYCLSIDDNYLKGFSTLTEPGDMLNYFKNGRINNSSMLFFIYENNIKDLLDSNSLVTETINGLLNILSTGNVFPLNDNFKESKTVGFLSNKRCYIGKYSQVRPIDGKVNVSGKIVELEETVESLLEYFLIGIKEVHKN